MSLLQNVHATLISQCAARSQKGWEKSGYQGTHKKHLSIHLTAPLADHRNTNKAQFSTKNILDIWSTSFSKIDFITTITHIYMWQVNLKQRDKNVLEPIEFQILLIQSIMLWWLIGSIEYHCYTLLRFHLFTTRTHKPELNLFGECFQTLNCVTMSLKL